MLYLMKCGHVAQAIDSNGKPCCAICAGIKEEAFIVAKEIDVTKNPAEGLEGRKAKCPYCGETTDSRWNLPFFQYKPNSDTDDYYDGCFGWD